MHFSAVLLAALSAGAHTLPTTTDATLGGDLNPELNNDTHNTVSSLRFAPRMSNSSVTIDKYQGHRNLLQLQLLRQRIATSNQLRHPTVLSVRFCLRHRGH